MTSSLVGSEMCIRDSSQQVSGGLSELPSAPRANIMAVWMTSSLTYGSGAVSYTHLTLPTICSV
eukprot:7858072-Prorocentrum_lima.AAC.1